MASSKGLRNWQQLSQAWSKDFGATGSNNQSSVASAMQRTLPLLQDPTSVPFVCRYRTDVIEPLTTREIHALCDRLQSHLCLDNLRNKILEKLPSDDQELIRRVQTSFSKTELDDIYAPLKPPPKGSLEDQIRQEHPELIPIVDAYWDLCLAVNGEDTDGDELGNGKKSPLYNLEKKLQPRDAAVILLANKIASHTPTTDAILDNVSRFCRIHTTKKEDPEQKYATYYDKHISLQHIRDHQVLAVRRGVAQKALKMAYDIDGDREQSHIRRSLVQSGVLSSRGRNHAIWTDAIHDSWTRLLRKRSTSRLWKEKCLRAEQQSIHVFCDNLQKALLAPPLQHTRPVLALDPGFQAGIKCAMLDRNGQLVRGEQGLRTVQFVKNKAQGVDQLVHLLKAMLSYQEKDKTLEKSNMVTIALGNGHGTQEANKLIEEAGKTSEIPIDIQLVNEAGASVWSVTEAAQEEFPKETPAAIAAVSIGRRYQNPLPELVKIPPRSLGLGMYQHDLSEKDLDEKLNFTSIHAVAEVGVDGNACSLEILEKVPGLTKTLSKRIMKARPLKGRSDLLSRVSGVGPKTFENCAAFIRIEGEEEPLDATLVHPESYDLARYLLKKLKWNLSDKSCLDQQNVPATAEARSEMWGKVIDKAATKYDFTKQRVLTVIDHLIISMTNPDPRLRGSAAESSNAGSILDHTSSCATAKVGSANGCSTLPPQVSTSLDALRKACPLRGITGTVRNVVDFGAFVDFGAENDGLVHRSRIGSVELGALLVGQEIGVDILDVSSNNRVSLSLAGLNLDFEQPGQHRGVRGTKATKRSYSTSAKPQSAKRQRPAKRYK